MLSVGGGVLPEGRPGGRRGSRVGLVLSRRGDVLVSQTQRARMLSSAVHVIAEGGYGQMSVARISAGAGVSRRTFYDCFADREDCFLAVFDQAVERAREAIVAGAAGQRSWSGQVRAGLLGLLEFLDFEAGARELLVVDAPKAGPRVQRRRGEVIAELSRALHSTGSATKPGRVLPELTGEGVVGAVLGVIHTRLSTEHPGSMLDLLNPLMGVITLPYLGAAAAQRELTRPVPKPSRARLTHRPASAVHRGNPLESFPMRVTHRTLLVLHVIAAHPGASNRTIAVHAGVSDQGQISKLLARLQNLGLIVNSSPVQPSGEPNQWQLTPRGQQLQEATQTPTTTQTP
jgi:AcrR family transcriptional regulator